MPGQKDGSYKRVNPSEHTNHSGKDWMPAKRGEAMSNVKERPSVTVSKPVKQDNPTNKPASSNAESKGPALPPGKPVSVKGVFEGSGAKTLAVEPTQDTPSTANSGEKLKLNKNQKK